MRDQEAEARPHGAVASALRWLNKQAERLRTTPEAIERLLSRGASPQTIERLLDHDDFMVVMGNRGHSPRQLGRDDRIEIEDAVGQIGVKAHYDNRG